MKFFLCVSLIILAITCLFSQNTSLMTDAVILGGIQGLTEFLPISSTAHLLIASNWLQSSIHFHDFKDFLLVLQLGSLIASVIFFQRHIRSICCGVFKKSPQGFRLLKNLIIGIIPTCILALILPSLPDQWIPWMLIFGSCLIVVAEKFYLKNICNDHIEAENLDSINSFQALKIGLFQTLAVFPGMSRSMVTIVGGYFCNFNRSTAVIFSFLLGLAISALATFYELIHCHFFVQSAVPKSMLLAGILASTSTSIIAIRPCIRFLQKHGMLIFAPYRLALALCTFYFFA